MNVATLSALSLVELKQLAKGRRIKQYYIMKRHALIQLLALPELPETFRLEKLTIHELRKEAQTRGIRGFWSLHRNELLDLLYPNAGRSHEKHQNCKDSQQNQPPQECRRDEVGSQDIEHRG